LAHANAQLLELNKKLEGLAVTDPLTGLKNRRFIDEALQQEVALYKRYKNPFSVLLLDVDHFKAVNDTYGHAKGDEILKYLANVLVQNSRESDTVGRFGGEEFFMLLHGTAAAGAQIVANRILEQVQQPVDFDGDSISVTVSIGIAELDGVEKLTNPKELIQRSDNALYLAKKNGRNRLEVFQVDADDQSEPDLQATG